MTKPFPAATFLAAALGCGTVMFGQQPNGAGVNSPWSQAEVIHVDDLLKAAQSKSNRPEILQVGFAIQYKGRHVPGAIYAGPGSSEEGLAGLKKAVAGIPKTREILLYCGCCPWDHCPNMKPAYTLLHRLGYTKIRVVEIPNSFGKDWVDKGYPVVGASAGASAPRQ